MKQCKEQKRQHTEQLFAGILYFMALFVPLIPFLCGYLMEGQSVPRWLEGMDANVPVIYRSLLLLLQILIFGCNCLFYRRVFPGQKGQTARALGVFLYMTCPCHIYVFCDRGDLRLAASEALLPLVVWALVGILQKRSLPLNGSMVVIGLAGLIWLNAEPASWAQGTGSYTVADLLRFWNYREGHPGLGMGVALAFAAALWLWIVARKRDGAQTVIGVCVVAVVLLAAALFTDLTQAAGWAAWMLCIPGARAGQSLAGDDGGEVGQEAGKEVLLLIVMAALGTCLYQCNWLTYSRAPMDYYEVP